MMPGYSASGGHASSGTGDQASGAAGFGSFNYNSQPPYLLIAVVVIGGLWLIRR